MKLCRFNETRLGCVQGGVVLDVTAALDVRPLVMRSGDIISAKEADCANPCFNKFDVILAWAACNRQQTGKFASQ